ncbi:MAG: exo,4-beta-D-glucosaminidase, partial [Gaiellaceae bacterium]|nr:exo,4-beta-D-glucosaminidase [Gaiellaceae bacterium]
MSWKAFTRSQHRVSSLGALVVVTLALALGLGGGGRVSSATRAVSVSSTELKQGWALRSATGLADTGATISQPGYATTGWNPISLPSTVLGGLVANGVYTNIYFGTNLQSVPDLTGQNWWFRGQFTGPAAAAGQVYWLRLKGV